MELLRPLYHASVGTATVAISGGKADGKTRIEIRGSKVSHEFTNGSIIYISFNLPFDVTELFETEFRIGNIHYSPLIAH